MAEKIYADGIFGNDASEKAPDYVVGGIAIVKDRFMAWLDEQESSDKGYVKLNITRQKKDASKWSFSLDTWKPKQDDADAPF